jgi:hypothetical protein
MSLIRYGAILKLSGQVQPAEYNACRVFCPKGALESGATESRSFSGAAVQDSRAGRRQSCQFED